MLARCPSSSPCPLAFPGMDAEARCLRQEVRQDPHVAAPLRLVKRLPCRSAGPGCLACASDAVETVGGRDGKDSASAAGVIVFTIWRPHPRAVSPFVESALVFLAVAFSSRQPDHLVRKRSRELRQTPWWPPAVMPPWGGWKPTTVGSHLPPGSGAPTSRPHSSGARHCRSSRDGRPGTAQFPNRQTGQRWTCRSGRSRAQH